jgi:hypothetical protein
MSALSVRPSAELRSGPTAAATAARARHVHWLRIMTILAALGSMAAGYGPHGGALAVSGGSCRSQHFVVEASSAEFARQVCAEAERFRRELAIEWLGRELPAWPDLCPIRVTEGPHLGAGGATSFTFIDGQPRNWEMQLQGSRERILDSVLPHEITHTILATHFGRPLPRWADEGAATSVEHASERTKQDRLLVEFLTTNRGIAFNRMFAMKEYPRDILPLYSQGYSLARFLIAQGGKHKFVEYVGDGMRWNNWTAATAKHYSMQSLSELQLAWLDWVRRGSPALPADVALAAHVPPVQGVSNPAAPLQPIAAASNLVPLPLAASDSVSASAPSAAAQSSPAAAGTGEGVIAAGSLGDGWYSRRRDEAHQETSGTTTTLQPVLPIDASRGTRAGRWLR